MMEFLIALMLSAHFSISFSSCHRPVSQAADPRHRYRVVVIWAIKTLLPIAGLH
jgi:hypothetical protein